MVLMTDERDIEIETLKARVKEVERAYAREFHLALEVGPAFMEAQRERRRAEGLEAECTSLKDRVSSLTELVRKLSEQAIESEFDKEILAAQLSSMVNSGDRLNLRNRVLQKRIRKLEKNH
jgi:hypothetical protein